MKTDEILTLAKQGKFSELINKLNNSTSGLKPAYEYVSNLKGDPEKAKENSLKFTELAKKKTEEIREIDKIALERKKSKVAQLKSESKNKIEEIEVAMNKISEEIKMKDNLAQNKNKKECYGCSNGEMKVKSGAYGKFLGCSNYPECKHTEKYVIEINNDTKDLQFEHYNLMLQKMSIENEIKIAENTNPTYTKEEVYKIDDLRNEKFKLENQANQYKTIAAGGKTQFELYYERKEIEESVEEKMKSFDNTPYLRPQVVKENYENLILIQNKINEELSDYKNFEGIKFVDVSAGGIQISGLHSEIKRYSYGHQATLKYDFSNMEESIEEFVEAWKAQDNEKAVEAKKRFIEYGERYGWD